MSELEVALSKEMGIRADCAVIIGIGCVVQGIYTGIQSVPTYFSVSIGYVHFLIPPDANQDTYSIFCSISIN